MAKKQLPKKVVPSPRSPPRFSAKETLESIESFRRDRISFRSHDDLKAILQDLADAQRRTLSQLVEMILIDHLRAKLGAPLNDDGALTKEWKVDTETLRARSSPL
jgi:hypothetical protein